MLSAFPVLALGAQGPGVAVSARITVNVPERRPATPPLSRGSDASDRFVGGEARVSASGRNDHRFCSSALSLGVIGRASVSCLETAEPAADVVGVAIEIPAGALGRAAVEGVAVLDVALPDGAAIRVPMRVHSRGGEDVFRATLPTAAFDRLASASHLVVRIADVSHALERRDLAGLRRLAADLRAPDEESGRAGR